MEFLLNELLAILVGNFVRKIRIRPRTKHVSWQTQRSSFQIFLFQGIASFSGRADSILQAATWISSTLTHVTQVLFCFCSEA